MANPHDSATGTNRTTVGKVLRSSATSTIVSTLAALVVLPRVLHGIDVNRYGEWTTLAAVLAIGQLAEAGVGIEISRRVAAAHGRGDAPAVRRAVREGTTVLVGVAAAIEAVGVAMAHPVVDLVFATISPGQRGQLSLLLIGVITLLAVGLAASGYIAVLGGLQRNDYSNWSGIAAVILAAGVTVGGIAAGIGIWALLVADAVQLLASWAGPVLGIRKLAPDMRFGLTRVSPGVALGFLGMPAMIVAASASTLFDSQVDKLVLTHNVGPRAAAMFQIGSQMVLSARAAALIPLSVLLAGTAELYRMHPGRLRRLEGLAGRSAQAIASVTAGGFLVFSSPFLHAWLGPGYGGAAMSLRLLAVAALVNVWSAPWFYYAVGRGRYQYVLVAACANLVVNASCTVLLTTRIGLLGALVGSVAGNGAGTCAGWLILRRWERRHWLRPALRASALVAMVTGPLLLLSPRIPGTWLGLICWVASYVAACGVVLLVTRSLPVVIAMTPRGVPRLAWCAESGH